MVRLAVSFFLGIRPLFTNSTNGFLYERYSSSWKTHHWILQKTCKRKRNCIYIYISIFIYSCMYVIFFCSVKSLIVTTSSPMSHLMMGVDPRNSNGFQRQAWTPMLRNFAPTCGRASLLVMAAGCLVRWVCLKKFWRKTHKSKWFIITLLLNSKHLGVTICGIHFIYSSNFLIHWGWGPYCGLPQVYFGTEFWLWSASIFTNIQWN